jgi:hypothetical protein
MRWNGATPSDGLTKGREAWDSAERNADYSGPRLWPVLLKAGQHPEFDPRANPTDAAINRYMRGSHGKDWPKADKPVDDGFIPSERAEFEVAEAEARQCMAVFDPAHARFVRLWHERMHPDPKSSQRQLLRLRREFQEATEAYTAARDALEKATARVTTIKMRAQERRCREAMARG